MTYKFEVPGLPEHWSDEPGLFYRSYSVYSGSTDSPEPSSLVLGSLTTTSGAATSIVSTSITTSTTLAYRGYFKPNVTSTDWKFRVTSDDGSYLWLDTNAELPVATLDPNDAIIDNSGIHDPTAAVSGKISLDSEFHYAMTLIVGNNTGSGTVTLEWSPDNGSNWYSNGTSYLSYDSRYPDGFGTDTYSNYSSTTATRWVAGTNEQYVGYAPNDSLTSGSWTFYDRVNDGHPASYDVAYGKDASGNGIYVMTQGSSTKEASVSSTDVTDGLPWTHKNFAGSGDFYMNVAWSNDVWITAGMDGDAFRSTDGADSWSKIDLSGVTGYSSTDDIEALAADGTGKWLMGQEDNLFYSTDDGASWSRVHSFTNTYAIKGIAYTNNSWVVAYVRSTDASKTYIRSAASSDLTTWSAEAGGGTLRDPDVFGNTGGFERVSIAADATGRIVILPLNRDMIGYADINGTTTPANFNVVDLGSTVPSGDDELKDVATDGSKWLIVGEDGVLLESTDSGETWTLRASEIMDSSHDIMNITADVFLPLT